jgi:hypothetical protein
MSRGGLVAATAETSLISPLKAPLKVADDRFYRQKAPPHEGRR